MDSGINGHVQTNNNFFRDEEGEQGHSRARLRAPDPAPPPRAAGNPSRPALHRCRDRSQARRGAEVPRGRVVTLFRRIVGKMSTGGTPRKPLLIRFVMKQQQSDFKTEEEVPTRGENASEEATLEGSRFSSSFRGLPCWSVTGRRGRKTKQSAAPTGSENEIENAAKILHPQMSPMVTESSSELSTNQDPRLEDNAAESNTSTDNNTNWMEVETSTWFLNSTHNAATELEAGHKNGNMATLSKKEDEKSCRDMKGKGIMIPISAVTSEGNGKETQLPHKCSICNRAFQTGPKLGGHMRAHFKGTLSSKRVKHNHGSSSSTAARDKFPDGSSSKSVNDIAPAAAASLSEDHTTKNSNTADAASSSAAGSVMTEMVLQPHSFNLNELPREADILAAASSSSSSSDTPTADVMLDLTLSL